MITEVLGWIGAVAFAICAIPQAIQCWKQGHGNGISALFLWAWFAGGVSMLGATLLRFGWIPWLAIHYFGNMGALLVIMRCKFWPKR